MFLQLGIELDQQTTWLDISQDVYWLPKTQHGEMTSPASSGTPSPETGTTRLVRFLSALLIAGTPLVIVYIHGVQKGKPLFCLKGESDLRKSPCRVDGPQKEESGAIRGSMVPEPHSNKIWRTLERLSLGEAVLP